MATTVFADNAKVMSKGQGDVVRVVNAASYAMQVLQQQMAGEAAKAGIASEEDVAELVSTMRAEA